MVATVLAPQRQLLCRVAVAVVIQFRATTVQPMTQVQAALEQHQASQAHLSLEQAVAVVVLTDDQEAQQQAQVAQAVVVQVQHLEQQQVEQ
jgi:K+/H+ antiporter YhaU regulatory subunit KhtT